MVSGENHFTRSCSPKQYINNFSALLQRVRITIVEKMIRAGIYIVIVEITEIG